MSYDIRFFIPGTALDKRAIEAALSQVLEDYPEAEFDEDDEEERELEDQGFNYFLVLPVDLVADHPEHEDDDLPEDEDVLYGELSFEPAGEDEESSSLFVRSNSSQNRETWYVTCEIASAVAEKLGGGIDEEW